MIILISFILIFIVFSASVSRKFNMPLIIIALVIGIIFGSDVTGFIYFDDSILAKEIANFALMFILFAGGFDTKKENFKLVVKPSMLLATLGVLLTANITAIIYSYLTGWSFLKSALLCAIISSTDAAAVFSILKTRSINKNIASITEIESAANDPMAIVSTTFILQLVISSNINTYYSLFVFIWQLFGGVIFGFAIGYLGVYLFGKIKEIDIGYYYLLLISLVLLSYGITDFAKASGMLAVFFTGFVIGNKKIPYKNGISLFSNTLSFISNVGLFVLLGLLVFPKQFSKIWVLGIALFLIITFIGRPLAVFICMSFMKLKFKEKIFLSWSGIRGAVPIVLATYPAAAGIDPNHEIFNIVFFAVTLSIVFQGTTIGKLSDILKLSSKGKTKPKQTMELVTVHDTNYELMEVFIDNDIYSGEFKISDLVLPMGTTITMITRNNSIIAPTGKTIIMPGDVLSVLVDCNNVEEVTNAVIDKFSLK